ncbi:MAG: cyclic nucleotide-binding domain-containing protein [Helicobacteraceae bacterium]|jgi:hypothetical protein|nr:cyclic nucleotide-binding domain-containing protein [Helicobacteraceae bacterium]
MFYHTVYLTHEISKLLEAGSKRGVPIGEHAQGAQPPQEMAELETAEQKLAETCRQIYLFEGIEPKDVMRVVKNARLLRFTHQERFFLCGDEGSKVFFILSGSADLFDKNGAKIGSAEAGSVVGEMEFITRKPRSYSCAASSPNTTAIEFEIDLDAISEETSIDFLQLYINVSYALAEQLSSAGLYLRPQSNSKQG